MASYRIEIKRSAFKEIDRISSKADRRRVLDRIWNLAANPRPPGCEKLTGQDRYRVRQGDYRIVYSIEDDRLIVYVVKVDHRKDVYRRD